MKAIKLIAFYIFIIVLICSCLVLMAEFGKMTSKAAEEIAKYILDTQGVYYE